MEHSNAQEQLHITHPPPQGPTGTVPTAPGIGDTAREGLPGEVGHCCHPEREPGAAPSLSGFLAGRDRVWVCRAKRGR